MDRTAIDRIARQLVRATSGEEAARRFDAALEDYGTRRAIEEALAGIGAGLLYQQALRQADRRGAVTAVPPLVDRRELDDDRPGFELIVDVPHDSLEVAPVDDRDDALWLRTESLETFAELPVAYADFEWLSEPGSGVSRLAVLTEVGE